MEFTTEGSNPESCQGNRGTSGDQDQILVSQALGFPPNEEIDVVFWLFFFFLRTKSTVSMG
jgi:hypothetical protein